jgi:hypothetical protein
MECSPRELRFCSCARAVLEPEEEALRHCSEMSHSRRTPTHPVLTFPSIVVGLRGLLEVLEIVVVGLRNFDHDIRRVTRRPCGRFEVDLEGKSAGAKSRVWLAAGFRKEDPKIVFQHL